MFHNVLITRFSALGDVAIAIPVVYSVCRAYPETRFIMVTRPWPASMMLQKPNNLVVEGVNLKEYDGIMGIRRLSKELRKKYDIDAVADLHSVMRTWVIDATMRLHGVKVASINKGRGEKRQLVKGKIHRQLTTSHDRYVKVFEKLGFTFEETFDGFKDLKTPFVPEKTEGEKWIAIAPFSQHEGKVLPIEQVEKVIAEVTKWDNVTVFLFGGGEKEKQALRPLVKNNPNTTSVAELKHDFEDELALMSKCDVMVSMDSANMHLASVVNLPVVSIWGATHPYCGFMGWRQKEENAVQLDLPCRPCSVFGNKPCQFGDYRCLTGITTESIVERIKNIIYG